MFESGPIVLALDVGTSSVRAMLFDAEARQLPGSFVKVPHRPTALPGDGAVYDADVLLKRIYGAIDAVASRAPEAFERVEAVGVSTFWHSLVGVDAEGRALTPLLLWVDMRSAPDAAAMRDELGAEEVRNRTGAPLHAAYVPPKLRWLKRTDPGTFDRCAKFLTLGELLSLRLHGEAVVSPAAASGQGLLDLRSGTWDEPLLGVLGLDPSRLGRLVPHDHCVSGLRPEFAARWPNLAKVPWAPTIGDGLTSNLGTAGVGSRRSNRIVAMVGTSASARTFVEDAPLPDPLPRGLWAYRFSPTRVLMGGSLGTGGNLIQWVQETFRTPGLEDAEAEIAWALDASDEIGPLTFLPFLAGERSLGWNDAARGVFSGVSFNTGPVDFLRAALEAIAFGIADVIDVMQPHVRSPELIGSGAAMIKSPIWIQILSDVLGRPVLRSPWKEASARGAAIVALQAAGRIKDLSEIPALPTEPVTPSKARHARYQEARAKYHDLYTRLCGRTHDQGRP